MWENALIPKQEATGTFATYNALPMIDNFKKIGLICANMCVLC